ncbi:MAG: HlyD family secretion protein [Blastocatellia bacterium]
MIAQRRHFTTNRQPGKGSQPRLAQFLTVNEPLAAQFFCWNPALKLHLPANYRSISTVMESTEPVSRVAQSLETKKTTLRRPLALFLVSALVLIGLMYGVRAFWHARNYEGTDDAFIEGQVVQLSPKVAGHVLKVYIRENQQVKQGDLLLELDPRDFEARLEQARAALQSAEAKAKAAQAGVSLTRAVTQGNVEQATAGVSAARSGVESARAQMTASRERATAAQSAIATAQANAQQAQAQVTAAEADARRTRADAQRAQQLFAKGDIARQQLEQAQAFAQMADAQHNAARQRAAAAQAQVNEAQANANAVAANAHQLETQVEQAKAQSGQAAGRLTEASAAPQQLAVSQAQAGTASADVLKAQADVAQAELQLSYTKVYAPADGRVTRKAVNIGSFVQAGQAMCALVQGELWVVANFKETQLNQLRPGQPVEISVDAFPRQTFRGHVDSIQKGAGARFSMMPPENATGNFVKVVQRVPVKIVFDIAPDPSFPLGPGMSVVPEVRVR